MAFSVRTTVGSDYVVDTFTITATSSATAQRLQFSGKQITAFIMVIDEDDIEVRIVRAQGDTDYLPIKPGSPFSGNFGFGDTIGYAYVSSGTATIHVLISV